jgi:hypothetical protein
MGLYKQFQSKATTQISSHRISKFSSLRVSLYGGLTVIVFLERHKPENFIRDTRTRTFNIDEISLSFIKVLKRFDFEKFNRHESQTNWEQVWFLYKYKMLSNLKPRNHTS